MPCIQPCFFLIPASFFFSSSLRTLSCIISTIYGKPLDYTQAISSQQFLMLIRVFFSTQNIPSTAKNSCFSNYQMKSVTTCLQVKFLFLSLSFSIHVGTTMTTTKRAHLFVFCPVFLSLSFSIHVGTTMTTTKRAHLFVFCPVHQSVYHSHMS